MKIRRATEAEKQAYHNTTPAPIYPLYGYMTIGGEQCAIEDLRGSWAKDDPQYEVMCPEGFHFAYPVMTHTNLCHTLEEVRTTEAYGLEPCTEDC